FDALQQTEVVVPEARRSERILAKVAVAETEGNRQPVVAERNQEPSVHFGSGESAQVTGQWIHGEGARRVEIGTVASRAVAVRVHACEDGERLARLERRHTRKLPATEDLLDHRRLSP